MAQACKSESFIYPFVCRANQGRDIAPLTILSSAEPRKPPAHAKIEALPVTTLCVHVPNFGGLSGSEDRGGGDNSIQFINFGRVGDKNF